MLNLANASIKTVYLLQKQKLYYTRKPTTENTNGTVSFYNKNLDYHKSAQTTQYNVVTLVY